MLYQSPVARISVQQTLAVCPLMILKFVWGLVRGRVGGAAVGGVAVGSSTVAISFVFDYEC